MSNAAKGYGFGTFKGVFTPSILTIIGVVMYLRFGWMLGNVGIAASFAILTISTAITFLTGLSISALATNMRVKGGGAYFIISRSFGIEAGAAIGIPLFFSQAVAIAFYTAGFTAAFCDAMPFAANWDPRVVSLTTLCVLFAIAYFSADLALKAQYVIMAAIAASIVSLALGTAPDPASLKNAIPGVAIASDAASARFLAEHSLGFWPVFAVFFPAVTGILSGLGMSGDLKNPGRSIPLGTIAAVATGYIVYATVLLLLHRYSGGSPQMRGALIEDQMFLAKCARWTPAVVAGIWAACLSSAIGSLLAAPRVLQALSRDGAISKFFGRGSGPNDDPRIASLVSFAIAAAVVSIGGLNAIAGILTMFNLTVYCMLNLSAGLEELLGNPSWRPTFRVRASLPLLGATGCLAVMLMIDAGSTFVAIICIMAVFFAIKRRDIKARWGDMRLGLAMGIARMALGKLDSSSSRDSHNWRPILLVMSVAPLKRPELIGIAAAISQNRSLVTVASVIPTEAWNHEREASMRDAIGKYLTERDIGAQVKILPAANRYDGMRQLVEAYGWGAISPNTILLGRPQDDAVDPRFASLIRDLGLHRRNAIIAAADFSGEAPGAAGKPVIDIWWRGKQGNAPFMLALAWLMMRDDTWRNAHLRICHLAEKPGAIDEARKMLTSFAAEARIDAECVVMPRNEAEKPLETICRISAKTDVTFLGLRLPADGETDGAYAGYLNSTFAATAALPFSVYAIAAENVDFKAIFGA